MKSKNIFISYLLIIILLVCSCKKFVAPDPPETNLVRTTVFNSDQAATSALLGVYSKMANSGLASGGLDGITYKAALSADELTNYSTSLEANQFFNNSIQPLNNANTLLWSSSYEYIYNVNSIIEGLKASSNISVATKAQLIGEAKFIRAYCYFYLTNLYGGLPLAVSSDYRVNAILPRTSQTKIYEQIIADLKEATQVLPQDYSIYGGERARATKGAATALLARVYLYTEDWVNAELQSTDLIDNLSIYSLEQDLNLVFLKNSNEAIFQLAPNNDNALEWHVYIFSSSPGEAALSTEFVNSFEPGDKRTENWIKTTPGEDETYYTPYKYKSTETTPITEYSMTMRLAEQFLIRAEARIHQQGKISEGIADLNIIRSRSRQAPTVTVPNPLPNLLLDLTQEEALLAVEQERKAELFTEGGHRWLDLKRTQRVNAIMSVAKPSWQPHNALYPIPQIQLQNDPAMANDQNPGYN